MCNVMRFCSQVMWPENTRLQHKLFQALFEFVVGFLLPVVVMAVCYSRLLLQLLRNGPDTIARGEQYFRQLI